MLIDEIDEDAKGQGQGRIEPRPCQGLAKGEDMGTPTVSPEVDRQEDDHQGYEADPEE
jgi:hypothetical protein